MLARLIVELGVKSHPTRDGWIEIGPVWQVHPVHKSHPTRDGWIEILIDLAVLDQGAGPIPHGMGGLKFFSDPAQSLPAQVPSHTGWVD